MSSSSITNADRHRLSGKVAIVGVIPAAILSDPVSGPHPVDSFERRISEAQVVRRPSAEGRPDRFGVDDLPVLCLVSGLNRLDTQRLAVVASPSPSTATVI